MRALVLSYFYWVTFSSFILTITLGKQGNGFRMPNDQETIYAVVFGYLITATFVHYGVVPI